MANKRQRKKQQKQETSIFLRSLGKSKKETKTLQKNPKEIKRLQTAEQRKIKRREKANTRSQLIRELGLKSSEHSSKRYWSDERFNTWYKKELQKKNRRERAKERKLKNNDELYLLIFWREKTAEGFADDNIIKTMKFVTRYYTDDELISGINRMLRESSPNGKVISQARTVIVKGSEKDQYISFMSHVSKSSFLMSDSHDWTLVYEGKVHERYYRQLLIGIYVALDLMYDASERASFFTKLIDRDLPSINKKLAARLASDTKWRSF